MKRNIPNRLLCLCLFTFFGLFAFAQSAKKVQIVKNGEVIQEYLTSDIDYIDVTDFISAPENVKANVSDMQITITWNAVENATYSIYRSADNVNFSLLDSDLRQTSYTDATPLQGTNYYKVKAVVNGVESGYTTAAAATIAGSDLGNGIYLGISGFNQKIYNHPIVQLSDGTVDGFRSFVDNLTMKNGTLLYYSVDQALNTLQSTSLPSDISTAAIVTFTDGLDQGSMMMDIPYDKGQEYLKAINNRINSETVMGQPIKAYSIGVRGIDVIDINMFKDNLSMLASSPDPQKPNDKYVFEVTSMSEVNETFKSIAEQLTQSNYEQTINIRMPGLSNGTLVRFTFDNAKSGGNSEIYIEGTFNRKTNALENVKYVGLTSTSGSTINGTKFNDVFVNYTFDKVHTDKNVLIKQEFTNEWEFTPYSIWQPTSEFEHEKHVDIVTKHNSAVIMLVLDCSSSLSDDFIKVQTNAKNFINTLYQAVDGSEGGNEGDDDNETTIYSTTPLDLSVAVWMEGKRYYLTQEQYKNANLSNATVEGLTVLSNMGNFIISPNDIQSSSVYKDYAMKYYSNILPDKEQATVISARYVDINNVLANLGWSAFSTSSNVGYMTKTAYNSDYNYLISLRYYTGGELAYGSNEGYVRGVKMIEDNTIVWNDTRDLTLAVKKDSKRYFLTNPNDDLTQYDEVEGVAVVLGDQKFIIRLNNEQSGTVEKSAAMSLYGDILPNKEQAEIISMKWRDINNALSALGGTEFSTSPDVHYMTKAAYNSEYNYQIYLRYYYGGSLSYGSYSGYIRGVKAFEDE